MRATWDGGGNGSKAGLGRTHSPQSEAGCEDTGRGCSFLGSTDFEGLKHTVSFPLVLWS